MYQRFTATSIDIDAATKNVIVQFSFDLDEDTINNQTVYVTDEKGDVINTELRVNDTELMLTFTGMITPNKVYFLIITKEVRSLIGANLYHAVKHEFQFKTTCRAVLSINSPVNFEDIKDSFEIKWTRIDEDTESFQYVRKEISTDPLFENILDSSCIDASGSIRLGGLETGKLYIRIRAENSESDFGVWSDSVTINYENTQQKPHSYEDELSDIFQRGLQVLTAPEQGESPISFIFEFDSELDPKSIEDNIIILQRKI